MEVRVGRGLREELGFLGFPQLHSLVWEIPAVIPAGNLEFGGKMKVEPLPFPVEIHPR